MRKRIEIVKKVPWIYRLSETINARVPIAGVSLLTAIGCTSVAFLAQSRVISSAYFFAPVIVILTYMAGVHPLLLVLREKLVLHECYDPREFGEYLLGMNEGRRATYLSNSLYADLLTEGIPSVKIAQALEDGVESPDGIREVANGAPVEWVRSWETGDAIGFARAA